jgi:dGTPase
MPSLASYAASDESSRGRRFPEQASPFRSQYQRDRDRIIHSSAFRRLEYKTQVFVNHEGDMFRTRLTHSLEVSQIGRTVARALGLNEDLTEAICLAHDLGHTPFGHAGQAALNLCMKDHGGFEHNFQSLRVVDLLEERYAEYPGLNLTFETREGILKHCSRKNAEVLGELGQRFEQNLQPGMEAQVANIADEIAYNNHDVDDGLRSGLISIDELRDCEIIDEHYQYVTDRWPDIKDRRLSNELIRRMINNLVTDLIETSKARVQSFGVESIDDVRNSEEIVIKLGENMHRKHSQLKRFLKKNLYNHEKVRKMAEKSRHIVVELFNIFINDPSLLPDKSASTISVNLADSISYSRESVVKDYIAGMTDRFAMMEYDRIMKLTT